MRVEVCLALVVCFLSLPCAKAQIDINAGVRPLKIGEAPVKAVTAVQKRKVSKNIKDVVIVSNNIDAAFTCSGNNCSVAGNNCTIKLRGNCSKLTITGNNNEVESESVAQVSISGNNNTVTWKSGIQAPQLHVIGINNETGESAK